VYFRLDVRITSGDVGSRVVVRWRRPAATGSGDEIADVLGMLETADSESFGIRKSSGELVTVPVERALAAKTVPKSPRQAPPRR
jgi:hypothetical protein